MTADSSDHKTEPAETPEGESQHHVHIPDLPLVLRLALLVFGWLIVVLGLAGLLLPGLQGILMLVLGAAILSVASESVHRWLEKVLEHRPNIRRRMNAFRAKLHARLSRPKSD
jgi:hypothetical protein